LRIRAASSKTIATSSSRVRSSAASAMSSSEQPWSLNASPIAFSNSAQSVSPVRRSSSTRSLEGGVGAAVADVSSGPQAANRRPALPRLQQHLRLVVGSGALLAAHAGQLL
jgi:hypothetical protein